MYALTSPNHDLAELRSLQDWFLKYELTGVPGVSEIASVGGFVKQYQITVDPVKLRAYDMPLSKVRRAVERSNNDVYTRRRDVRVRVHGSRPRVCPVGRRPQERGARRGQEWAPVLLADVGRVSLGPDMRRGVADLDGDGEVVGGIVIVRSGANAYQVIADVKEKLQTSCRSVASRSPSAPWSMPAS